MLKAIVTNTNPSGHESEIQVAIISRVSTSQYNWIKNHLDDTLTSNEQKSMNAMCSYAQNLSFVDLENGDLVWVTSEGTKNDYSNPIIIATLNGNKEKEKLNSIDKSNDSSENNSFAGGTGNFYDYCVTITAYGERVTDGTNNVGEDNITDSYYSSAHNVGDGAGTTAGLMNWTQNSGNLGPILKEINGSTVTDFSFDNVNKILKKGKDVQYNTALKDVKSYVKDIINAGYKDNRAILYLCDIKNNYGHIPDGFEPSMTFEEMHSAYVNNIASGTYRTGLINHRKITKKMIDNWYKSGAIVGEKGEIPESNSTSSENTTTNWGYPIKISETSNTIINETYSEKNNMLVLWNKDKKLKNHKAISVYKGTVVKIGNKSGYTYVIVQTKSKSGKIYYVKYGHLKQNVSLKVNDSLEKGDIIGTIAGYGNDNCKLWLQVLTEVKGIKKGTNDKYYSGNPKELLGICPNSYVKIEDFPWLYQMGSPSRFSDQSSACGIFSLTMVTNYYNPNSTMTPQQVRDLSGNNYTGALNSLITKGLLKINGDRYSTYNEQKVINSLKSRNPIILRANPNTININGRSYSEHYVVIAGITSDNKLYVADPGSVQSTWKGFKPDRSDVPRGTVWDISKLTAQGNLLGGVTYFVKP